MRAALPDLLARRRRPVLVTAAAGAVLVMLVAALAPPIPGLAVGLLALAVALVILYAAAAAAGPPRPGQDRADVLLVAGGAFATPRGGAFVIAGVAHLVLIAGCFVAGVHDSPVRAPWLALVVAFAAPLAFYGPGLWRGVGVTFTPEGLRADKLPGSVFIPWPAVAAEQPHLDPGGAVTVVLADPASVTTSGWPSGRDRLAFDRTRREFVAAAVRYYATHPHDRAAIGTEAGYERLRAAEVPDGRAPVPPRSRRWVAANAVSGGLIAVTALALFAWIDTRLDGHGVLGELPQALIWALFFGVGQAIAAATAGYRRSRPRGPGPVDEAPARPSKPPWARDVTGRDT